MGIYSDALNARNAYIKAIAAIIVRLEELEMCDMRTFQHLAYELRAMSRMTQLEIAKVTGNTQTMVARWERGEGSAKEEKRVKLLRAIFDATQKRMSGTTTYSEGI